MTQTTDADPYFCKACNGPCQEELKLPTDWRRAPTMMDNEEYRQIGENTFEVRNEEFIMRLPRIAYDLWCETPLAFAYWVSQYENRNTVAIWKRN